VLCYFNASLAGVPLRCVPEVRFSLDDFAHPFPNFTIGQSQKSASIFLPQPHLTHFGFKTKQHIGNLCCDDNWPALPQIWCSSSHPSLKCSAWNFSP